MYSKAEMLRGTPDYTVPDYNLPAATPYLTSCYNIGHVSDVESAHPLIDLGLICDLEQAFSMLHHDSHTKEHIQ